MSFFMIIDRQFAATHSLPEHFTWHVPERKPLFNVAVPVTISIVVFLQATDDELELLKKRFTNLPISHAICTWRGAMAQFVYDNI